MKRSIGHKKMAKQFIGYKKWLIIRKTGHTISLGLSFLKAVEI